MTNQQATKPRTRRGSGCASIGAVAQAGGSLPIYICNACQTEVVWCDSRRTGRKYLVNVSRGRSGARFYMGHNIHKCEATLAGQAEFAREEYYKEVSARHAKAQTAALEAGQTGLITQDEMFAAFDLLADADQAARWEGVQR